jgi:uncharacterized protein YfaS (alpha-2-macroglobulin family)
MLRFVPFWLLLACSNTCSDDPTAADPSQDVGGVTVGLGSGSGADGAEAAATPIDPATLHPHVQAVGPAGALPTEIMVDLVRDVITDEQLAAGSTAQTRFELQPDVPGTLSWVSRRRLRFVPDAPFAHSTSYTATLRTLDGRDGQIILPTEVATSFTTPAFSMLYAELVTTQAGSAVHQFNAVFSGPVDPAAIGAGLVVRAGSETLIPTEVVSEQAAPHKVWFSANSPALIGADTATVVLRSSVAGGGGLASPTRSTIKLPPVASEHWNVLEMRVREGTSGFMIEVTCTDEGAEGWERYYWDRETERSWWLSSRCQLTPESLDAIHLDPPVDLTVVPSGGGFRLQGDFRRGHYTLRIESSALTVDGSPMARPFEQALFVPERSPSLQLTDEGRYLHRDAWGAVPLRHRNTPDVRVVLRHIPRQNLLFWLSGEQETATSRTSDVLGDVTIPLRAPLDQTVTTWLSLSDLVPTPAHGVYEITTTSGTATDVARLMVTDLELVAKSSEVEDGGTRFDVWALGVHDHKPIPGAVVSLVRPSGKVLGTCTTASDGGCAVSYAPDRLDPTPPLALLVEHGGDMAYLRFDDVRVPLSESEVAGEPWRSEQPYRAALYTDRGVYRPGETAHVSALLRTDAAGAPPAGMPVRIELKDPRGKVFRRIDSKTNAAGLVSVDVPLHDYATTGTYEAVLTVADALIARKELGVEEFVPERMSVTAAIAKADHALGEPVTVEVSARYLFGGSAAGSRVEATCRIDPVPFQPAQNRQLVYSRRDDASAPRRTVDLGVVTATLDRDGRASLTCPPPEEGVGLIGTGRLVADVAVFEAGSGRTTRGRATSAVHPEAWYVGLSTGARQAQAGVPLTIEGTVVDWTGAVAAAAISDIQVELFRLEEEWDWSWDEGADEEVYRRLLRPVAEGTERVAVRGGKFTISPTPAADGAGFLVRVTAGGAETELQLEMPGRQYWWSDPTQTHDQTARPMAPTSVEIELPDEIFVDAETPVTFEAPYAGRALITLETDRVLSHSWVDVKPGTVKWRFTLDDFAPNVYVGVLILKDPHGDDAEAFLPARAFGTTWAKVRPDAYTQTLTLDVPEEVRSRSTLEVGVAVTPPAADTWVTIAVVDEGVLALTDFESPDPFPSIFPKRALGVATFETLGWHVARASRQSSSRTGGDGGGGPARVSPVKPVALWSGLVQLDAAGKAVVKFEVPEYRGQLRIMAVSASPDRMGHADAAVLVRDPLVVQTTLPRFLIEGDEAQIPVFLTNLSGSEQNVRVSLVAKNLPMGGFVASNIEPVRFLGAKESTVKLADGASRTLVFRITATSPIGAARLAIRAEAGSLVSEEHLDVPLAPDAPRTRSLQQIRLQPGDNTLAAYLQGWMPTTERTTLWVTPNPYAEALGHLEYLVRYPYGCIEQTTSSTRPLLYVGNLLPAVMPEVAGRGGVDDMIRSGLERILSMQTTSGGFGYWPGDQDPTFWGTVYATHLLIDARDEGHEVSVVALNSALTWLETELSLHPTASSNDYYRHTEAYAHYVLALAGKPQKGRAAALLAALGNSTDGEVAEARYLVQAALHLAGDRRYAEALAAPDLSPLTVDRRNGWSYYSDLRRRGLMLSIATDVLGDDATSRNARASLARLVARGLSGRRSQWYTTQEIVWAVTGLGKYVGDVASAAKPTKLLLGGVEVPSEQVAEGLIDQRWTLPRASEQPGLTLKVDNPTNADLFVLIDSEGVRPDTPWKLGGQGLQVTRTYVDGDKQPLDPTRLKLGTMVYTVVKITNTSGEEVQNIAMVDRMPAGWELENPRLGRGAEMGWIDELELWEPDHMNLRDDRVEVFGSLGSGESREIVYGLRAVTAGAFAIPPVEAEAMYDPDIWARSGGGVTVIDGTWDAFFL